MKKKLLLIFAILLVALTVCGVLTACGEKTYIVNFSGADVSAQTVEKGGKAARPVADPGKTGYDFAGYFKDAGYANVFDFETEEIRSDTTIFVKFDIKRFTVTFHNVDMEPVKADYGTTLNVSDPEPNAGQAFAGWYTNSNLTKNFEKTTKITKDIDLWAKWTEVETPPPPPSDTTVTVSFENPSTGERETFVINKGMVFPYEDLPYFEHFYSAFYNFEGWDKDVEAVLNEDTTFVAQYSLIGGYVLPEEIFTFTLLDDDTYSLKLRSHLENFNAYKFSGPKIVPDTHNGKPVSRIDGGGLSSDWGTSSFGNITQLFVPSKIKYIGTRSFAYFPASYVWFEAVEELGADVFDSSNVKNVYLPATLREIGENALCSNKTINFTLDEDNACFITETDEYGNEYFYDTAKTVVYNIKFRSSEFTVESELEYHGKLFYSLTVSRLYFKGDFEEIPEEFAIGNSYLTYVGFNGTVKKIGKNAFKNCRSIKNMLLPNGVEYIGEGAFFNVMFSELVIPSTLTFIGQNAFSPVNTCAISIEAGNADYYVHGGGLIERGTGIEYNGVRGDTFMVYFGSRDVDVYSIPEAVTTLAASSFSTIKIKELRVPEGVRELPADCMFLDEYVWDYSVQGQVSLKDVLGTERLYFPSTLEKFGRNCLHGGNITNIIYPNGCNVKTIVQNAITLERLPKFFIPKSMELYEQFGVTGAKGFETEEGGKYIAFGASLFEKLNETELKLVMFNMDPNTDEFIMPDTGDYTVTVIGRSAKPSDVLKIDPSIQPLRKCVIPEGVEVIEEGAFWGNALLEQIVLPSTIKEIHNSAFEHAKALKSLRFLGEVPPKLGSEITSDGYNGYVFDMTSKTPIYAGFPLEGKIFVPEGAYREYFDMLYAYRGENYASRVSTDNVPMNTYRFHTNGGNEIADVSDTPVIYTMPPTWWKGEGKKHLQGYYTAEDQTGERVSEWPFFGTPDANGVVHLYAKWGNTRFEDGTDWEFAYELTTQKRELTMEVYTYYFFEFVPETDGKYAFYADGEFMWQGLEKSNVISFYLAKLNLSGVPIIENKIVIGMPLSEWVHIGGSKLQSYSLSAGERYFIYTAFNDRAGYDEDGNALAIQNHTANFWMERIGDAEIGAIT